MGDNNKDKKIITINRSYDKSDMRNKTDNILDRMDAQTINNLSMELEINKYVEEMESNINKIKKHGYYPSDKEMYSRNTKQVTIQTKEVVEESPVHGEDCHCSKCCPNPNPNFFQKNKLALLMGVLWVALVILAVGWSPSGKTFEAIQTSYVELIVNFFKMGIFFVAGLASYHLMKKKKDE